MKESLPPLLRGIGTLLILTAAVIAFCIGRKHEQNRDTGPSRNPNVAAKGSEIAALASEVRELRAEVEQENVVVEVLDNRWFDWISFAGTAAISASFFTEACFRRKKSTESRENIQSTNQMPLARGPEGWAPEPESTQLEKDPL